MVIYGSSVHDEITSRVEEIENKSSKLQKEIYGYENKITSLTEERETILSQLALKYLPDLEAESVRQALTEVQAEVKNIFAQKQGRRKSLEDMMESCTSDKKRLDKELYEVTDQLNAKVKYREEISAKVKSELQADFQYTNFIKNAEKATEILTKHQENAGTFEAQTKIKIPEFEKNKYFKYLLDRGFGTETYKENGIAGRLDSWLADIVDFTDQKKNYDFLKQMPGLMRQKISEEESKLSAIKGQIANIEKKVSDSAGLPLVMQEGNNLAKKRASIISEIEKRNSLYSEYSQERKNIDSTKDPFHRQAVQKLKEFLKGETITELKEKARQTPGEEDDLLVGKIEEIDSEIRQLKDSTKEVKNERDSIEEKLHGLKTIESKFRGNDYESSRSRFSDDFDLNSLLLGYIAGKITTDHINHQISENQHFKPAESYHSSYSSSSDDSSYSPSSSSFSFGSSSSPSSFSSGGGFGGGGGGFSSGSGF